MYHAGMNIRSRAAFTLIELLVVIGVILVLVGLLVPMGFKALRASDRARTAGDLQTISMALEAFHQDFQDYPRTEGPNTGFAVLGRYLAGTYGDGVLPSTTTPPPIDPNDPPAWTSGTKYQGGDAVRQGSNKWVAVSDSTGVAPSGSAVTSWAQFDNVNDGVDGPGIKRPTGGRTLGPYVTEKSNVRGLALRDHHGGTILYFPASPGKPNIHATYRNMDGATRGGYADIAATTVYNAQSMYNLSDGCVFFRAINETNDNYAIRTLQKMLGDTDCSGLIDVDKGEKEATTGPYLLWSPGPDGNYGPLRSPGTDTTAQDIQRCDDVKNF